LPLYDWTDKEIVTRLRELHEPGNYYHAPNDFVRELQRRTEARHAKVAIVTSIISAITATIAVVLSVASLLLR
jgi:hypothetical protein